MKYRVISEKPITIKVLKGSKLEDIRFEPGEAFLAAPKHAQKLLGAGEFIELVNDEPPTVEPSREPKKTSTRAAAQTKSKTEVSE